MSPTDLRIFFYTLKDHCPEESPVRCKVPFSIHNAEGIDYINLTTTSTLPRTVL